MKIYIASSINNLISIQLLTATLKDHGHTVLDWTRQPWFTKAIQRTTYLQPEQRRLLFDTDDRRGTAFSYAVTACTTADLVIYLGPSGQDAAVEVGIAFATGIPVFALLSPLESPGLLLNGCVAQCFASINELLPALKGINHTVLLDGYGTLPNTNFGNGHGQGRENDNASKEGQKQNSAVKK